MKRPEVKAGFWEKPVADTPVPGKDDAAIIERMKKILREEPQVAGPEVLEGELVRADENVEPEVSESKDLIPFVFEGHKVNWRVADDGEPEVMAADVLRVLGYPESSIRQVPNAIKHVPEEWRCLNRIKVSSRNRHGAFLREVDAWFLKREGFYLFVNRSDKPNALPFQKWVNGEVLPTLFKTGRYQVGGREIHHPILG